MVHDERNNDACGVACFNEVSPTAAFDQFAKTLTWEGRAEKIHMPFLYGAPVPRFAWSETACHLRGVEALCRRWCFVGDSWAQCQCAGGELARRALCRSDLSVGTMVRRQ